MYTRDPNLSVIPWVSGIILLVIFFTVVFKYHWPAILFINLAIFYILGPVLTKGLLVKFASGKGLEHDIVYSFIGGFITLIKGLITQ